jgi:phage virion morphogenesis protein
MMSDPIEIKLDNKEIETKLLDLAKRGENLRPLMKNIAGIFAYAAEENFKNEGRPDKWEDLKEVTKKKRAKKGHWPGSILQVEGKLAASVSTYYDDDSAIIGSNLPYAAIHQLGGDAGKDKKVKILARPYLKITESEQKEILNETLKYLQ